MTPRLLTEQDAADYLNLPRASVRRLAQGRVMLDGRVRWDRVALDEWLDVLRGRGPQSAANSNATGPDAALSQWLSDKTHAPRRS